MSNDQILAHSEIAIKHLYVNLLRACNLRCKMCYVPKTADFADTQQLLKFIKAYSQAVELQSVTLCGGEVFLHPDAKKLINQLTELGILVIIITNGTIDYLDKLSRPEQINLLVSVDGLPDYHDANRGAGNFEKSINMIKHGLSLGMSVEIFSVVTRNNFSQIGMFEKYLTHTLNTQLPITYHPRKPKAYLMRHPHDNIEGEIVNFEYLNTSEYDWLKNNKKIFPPKELGCYQIAIDVEGQIRGCCEGRSIIGNWHEEPKTVIRRFYLQLQQATSKCHGHCLGCIEPDFCCGLDEYGIIC